MAARTRQRAPRHRSKPDALARVVGTRIQKLRKAADFNFDAFVEETGLGRGYVSELERGLVVPTITTLAKVAAALELTLADLVLGETPRERLFDALRGAPESEIERVVRLLGTMKKTQPRPEPLLRVSEPKRGRPSDARGETDRDGTARKGVKRREGE